MPRSVRNLKTPLQVQRWLYSLQYNTKETMHSLPGVLRIGKAHCLEAVLASAVILERHGYPPLILDLESADNLDHTLFLYQQNGKYGSVGWSRDFGLNGRKPIYKTIRQLVQSYAAPYIDARAKITAYGVFDLRTMKKDWRSSIGNVWFVEDALRNFPHKKLSSSKSFVQRWRKKYLRFKQLHPGQQPHYFPNQKTWL